MGAVLEGQNFEWREWGHALVSAGTVSEGKTEPSRVAWEGERWSEEMVIIIEDFTVGV